MRFTRSFAEALPELCEATQPEKSSLPRLVFFNSTLASELELDASLPLNDPQALAELFVGNRIHAEWQPVAQAYAGHQFGHFSPRLGDGRALLLSEVELTSGSVFDLTLKGSGRTRFSRGGDGKAALGPMLREVLISEALHALGIPCTRALAVVLSGDTIFRQKPLPGAVLTRVAASHIRIGSFEYVAAHHDTPLLKRLADFTIARHRDVLQLEVGDYLGLVRATARLQASLVAQWLHAGFVHGVMNTDNVVLSGESIDFGPCAMLDRYDSAAVFSSIDHQGRYAYGNQPRIAQWNVACLANALLPLIDSDSERAVTLAQSAIGEFSTYFEQAWLQGARDKLGLMPINSAQNEAIDTALARDFLQLLARHAADYTRSWRALCDAAENYEATLLAELPDTTALRAWLTRWRSRCAQDDADGVALEQATMRANKMRRVNPWIIARNHQLELALNAASESADFSRFETLLTALRAPYVCDARFSHLTESAPAEFSEEFQTFCGT